MVTIRKAHWPEEKTALQSIRHEVFVNEQGVPEAIEWDGEDDSCEHFVAFIALDKLSPLQRDYITVSLNRHLQFGRNHVAIGTARLTKQGQIGRMAVLLPFRRFGYAALLLKAAVSAGTSANHNRLFLHAQIEAQGFYAANGFIPKGDIYQEAGIDHINMELSLLDHRIDFHPPHRDTKLPRERITQQRIPAEVLPNSPVTDEHILNQSNKVWRLSNSADFRLHAINLSQQCRHKILLYSNDLEAEVYDTPEFSQALSTLARRHSSTKIQVLIRDSRRIVRLGHRVLSLSKRLSTAIQIRRCDPNDPHITDENFILGDNTGILYRPNSKDYQGFVHYNDKQEQNRRVQQFTLAWEHAYQDPELKEIRL